MMHKISYFIDWRQGLLWGFIIGGLVGVINLVSSDYNVAGSLTAAIKQGVYTFFFGGFINRFTEWLALRPGKPKVVFWVAIIVPIIVTTCLVYLVHSLRGTPSPVLSTIPVFIFSLMGYPLLVIHKQKGQKNSEALASTTN